MCLYSSDVDASESVGVGRSYVAFGRGLVYWQMCPVTLAFGSPGIGTPYKAVFSRYISGQNVLKSLSTNRKEGEICQPRRRLHRWYLHLHVLGAMKDDFVRALTKICTLPAEVGTSACCTPPYKGRKITTRMR